MDSLPKYSGDANFVGYPYYYLVNWECQCADCATVALSKGEKVEPQVNWENPELYCDKCSTRIESAYADEDSEE